MGKKCEREVRRFILYRKLLKIELKEMKKGGTSRNYLLSEEYHQF
jgi:hypothetical protein